MILAIFALFSWIMFHDARDRQTNTRTISIVTSLLPPYMDEQGQGREAEIIKAALFKAYRNDAGEESSIENMQSVTVNFNVQPFTRHWMSFLSDPRYDAVTTVPRDLELDPEPELRSKFYKSDVYVEFQNGIGYRMKALSTRFDDFSIDDLAGLRVVAFAGASRIISQLGTNRDKFPLYLEEPDQKIHSKLLSEGLVDAVVADGAIFFEYNRRLMHSAKMPDAAFSAVFCPTPYVMVFRSAKLRDDFNKGLKIISENGTLRAIQTKYTPNAPLKNSYYIPKECQQ